MVGYDTFGSNTHQTGDATNHAGCWEMKRFIGIILTVGLLALSGAPVLAAIGLTDSYAAGDNSESLTWDRTQIRGQTWTAASSYQLAYVEIYMRRIGAPGDVVLNVRTMSGNVPSSTNLVSVQLAAGNVPIVNGWARFDIPAGTAVKIGGGSVYWWGVYAISGDQKSNYYAVRFDRGNGYKGGNVIDSSNGGGTWDTLATFDDLFRIYGDSPAVTAGTTPPPVVVFPPIAAPAPTLTPILTPLPTRIPALTPSPTPAPVPSPTPVLKPSPTPSPGAFPSATPAVASPSAPAATRVPSATPVTRPSPTVAATEVPPPAPVSTSPPAPPPVLSPPDPSPSMGGSESNSPALLIVLALIGGTITAAVAVRVLHNRGQVKSGSGRRVENMGSTGTGPARDSGLSHDSPAEPRAGLGEESPVIVPKADPGVQRLVLPKGSAVKAEIHLKPVPDPGKQDVGAAGEILKG